MAQARAEAELVREYGPFPGVERVHGVSFDGTHVWFACGEKLCALDPERGDIVRELALPARSGTAFDGRFLYQMAGGQIQKIEPDSGKVVATIPAPSQDDNSGLAWAEGVLWVGQYGGRKIVQVDPDTGAVLRTLDSPRFVTGVTWSEGELWHATWENEVGELRRIDPESGAELASVSLPHGQSVTGLESDGKELFFCGGGARGTVRALKKPRAAKR